MKKLKIALTFFSLVLGSQSFANQDICHCSCHRDDVCFEEEIDIDDEDPGELYTLLYLKGGVRWYPSPSVTWPSLGLGWRCHRGKTGFDLSVSTAHPTMNFGDFKHYFNINGKALGLFYLCPTSWSSLFWGVGLGVDHHQLHSFKATAGTLEALIGYEFPFCRESRAFLQLEASQPIYAKGGFRWYDATAVSLMLGVGY